jgi:hypothetical protein
MAHDSSRKTSLVKIGGSIGIAATFIALASFVMALFGFLAAMMLSPLALVMGLVGIVVSIAGAVMHPAHGDEETQPIAALFVCLMAIVGGLIQFQIWRALPPG